MQLWKVLGGLSPQPSEAPPISLGEDTELLPESSPVLSADPLTHERHAGAALAI
jgi:hypothetical protein